MNNLKVAIGVAAAVFLTLATLVFTKSMSLSRLKQEHATLQAKLAAQTTQLQTSQAENQKLTREKKETEDRAAAEHKELLSLRSEVSSLRQKANTGAPGSTTAAAVKVPKDLSNVGRATAADALQTFKWAVASQNADEMMRSITSDPGDPQPDDVLRRFITSIGPRDINGISPKPSGNTDSEEKALIMIKSKTYECTLRKIDSEWKIVVFATHDAGGRVILRLEKSGF